MKPWLNHPAYSPLRDALLKRFQDALETVSFRTLKRIVFLCGAANSYRRRRVRELLSRRRDDVLVFLADDVWLQIANQTDTNALDMEQQLAELSDLVVIIVESAGSIAELGAFSLSDSLRAKLLPILDRRFEHDKSFINTGPVRWVDRDSAYGPSIYADFDAILEDAEKILLRLNHAMDVERKISKRRPRETSSLLPKSPRDQILNSAKHSLFFLCDLVHVLGVADLEHIYFFSSRLLPKFSIDALLQTLALATALGVLRVVEIEDKEANKKDRFYFRSHGAELSPTFMVLAGIDFNIERAKVLGVLQRVPSALEVLDRIEEMRVSNVA